MQIIIRLKKIGLLRFLSATETANAVVKALRRSGLPLEYTHGFNPKPKVSFLDSTPTGLVDLALYVAVRLKDESFVDVCGDLEEWGRRVEPSLPSGLILGKVFVSQLEMNKVVDGFEYLLLFKSKPELEKPVVKHSGKVVVPIEVIEELNVSLKKDFFVVRYRVKRDNIFNPQLISGLYLGLRTKALVGSVELDDVLSKWSQYPSGVEGRYESTRCGRLRCSEEDHSLQPPEAGHGS